MFLALTIKYSNILSMSEFLYFMSMAFPMIHKSAKNEGKSIVIVIGQENMFMSSVQDNF